MYNSFRFSVGNHINTHYIPNGKHYGNRSHSEADLLSTDLGTYGDYDSRTYTTNRSRMEHHHHNGHSSHTMSNRKHSSMGLVYPNIQVHCLDVNPGLRGVSLQAKAGDLFAIMATSQPEGTALTECLSGLKDRISGEVLVNGQQINRRGLRELCSYVPALDCSSLDPRMSVQCTLNFHAALRGPIDRSDFKEKVGLIIQRAFQPF